MNSMKIGTYQMDTTFGLYLPEYTIPAPAVQTNFVKIIGRDGSVDLSNALGLHYDSRTWSLDFKCFDPTVNWHTLSSQVMNAIHGKRLNFEFDDDPNYFWTGRVSVQNYVSNHGTGTLKVTIVSDPFKYAKLSTIVTKTASTGTDYTGSMVTFNDGLIYDLSADIEPIQDLHGYSSPWIGTDYDQQPYNFRAVSSSSVSPLGNSEMGNIVGGTVSWNQLVVEGKTLSRNFSARNGTLTVGTDYATYTASSASTLVAVVTTTQTPKVLNSKFIVNFDIYPATSKDVRMWLVDYSANISILRPVTANKWNNVSGVLNIGSANNLREIQLQLNCTEVGEEDKLKNVSVYNLTQMFGSTIADYIYGLEQNTEGAGVAWFRKLFPKDYYAYDAGSLLSVKTSAHKEVGFNQWDEEWDEGAINVDTGENYNQSGRVRVKNYIPIIPNTTYYKKSPNPGMYWHIYYDADKNWVGKAGIAYNTTFTTPANAYYMRSYTENGYGATYKNDICINLHWDGERDGEYEPYEANTYALDDVELRGIPKLDASNNLYYDGDSYAPDGTVTRKYGIVDLGSSDVSWVQTSSGDVNVFRYNGLGGLAVADNNAHGIISGKYTFAQTRFIASMADKTWMIDNSGRLSVRDDSYTDVATFKTAMSGVYLVYELATPTTESAEPYTSPQSIDQYGTEEYVDAGVAAGTRDVAIPVGHYTNYANICPISGLTGLSVYVSPTTAQADATTYSVDWSAQAGTVYGGTLDVVTGVLTVTMASVDLGSLDWTKSSRDTTYKIFSSSGISHNAKDPANNWTVPANFICSQYKTVTFNTAYAGETNGVISYAKTNKSINVADGRYSDYDATAFKSAMSGVQLCYELATPLTYQLTPQEIQALVGTNNVWSDGGNVTVAVVTPETLTNNGRAVVPTLTASADMVLKWGNYSASVQQGISTIPQLILENGANLIYIIGAGSISFTWQEVRL